MRILVSLAYLLSLFFIPAQAYDFEVKGVYYTILSDNEVAVVKGEKGYSGVVNIPQQVTHSSVLYTVSEIGKEAFSSCTTLKEVVLPNSIRKIHDNAFALCFSLRNYRIPDSTEYIGNSAFRGCPSPDTLFIPEKVAHIGEGAFSGNKNLKWIEAAHFNRYFTSENGVLFNSLKTEIVAFPAAKKGHYDIPPTITAIGNDVFSRALNLTSVKIPYSVTEIGKQAFWYCSALQSVDIPPSVILIDEQAFAFCSSLKEISIPASVQYIGKEAFLECKSLKSIEIPSSISVVNERTFAYCTSLERVNIKSATVRAIDKLAFSYCTNLKELSLPSTVFYVGHGAFYPCKKLSSIRVHHVNPLPLNGFVFSDVDKSRCKVYVPANSVQKYKESPEWKDFKNFIPMHYRFTVSFTQPQNGTLQLFADSTAVESGVEFAQGTEFTLTLACDDGYELDRFVINGLSFDALPNSFTLMDDTTIEVKLKRSRVIRERVIELAENKKTKKVSLRSS